VKFYGPALTPIGSQEQLPEWAQYEVLVSKPSFLLLGISPSGIMKRRIYMKSCSALNKGRQWEARGMEVVRIAIYPKEYHRMSLPPYKGKH